MSLPYQKFRELVFISLYSRDMDSDLDLDAHLGQLMRELKVSRKNVLLAFNEVEKVLKELTEIDQLIEHLVNLGEFKNLERVEKNIIRVALYEIFFNIEIPNKVSISEAIRLTRKFSLTQGAAFVNALLDYLFKNLLSESKTVTLQEVLEVLEKKDGQMGDIPEK